MTRLSFLSCEIKRVPEYLGNIVVRVYISSKSVEMRGRIRMEMSRVDRIVL